MKSFVMAAVAGMVLTAGAFAGEKTQAPAPVAAKPVAKAEPKVALVEQTKWVKETKLVPVTSYKKVKELVAVPVADCTSCCEVASVRGRLRDRVGLLGTRVGTRVRGATVSVAECVTCK